MTYLDSVTWEFHQIGLKQPIERSMHRRIMGKLTDRGEAVCRECPGDHNRSEAKGRPCEMPSWNRKRFPSRIHENNRRA